MSNEKIDEIVTLLMGLSQVEWNRISHAVNMVFSSASLKLVLEDAEKLKYHIKNQ